MSFIFRLVAILKAAKTVRIAGMAVATLTVTIVFGGSAVWGQTGPLIVVNSLSPIGTADSPGGPVTTFDFATGATVARFIPPRSFDMYSGHGVTVLDNEIYLTALNQADRSSDSIHVFPVNGGAGGAEVRTLPNPRPGLGIQNLSFSGGVLYALTGWTRGPAQIFGLNPVTGAVLTGPVPIAAATPNGFTVLPNGHFLVSSGPCTYTEFDLVTGALIPGTTIGVPGGVTCTGVDTDGDFLYFQRNDNSIVKTTLSGAFVASMSVSVTNANCPSSVTACLEDISLVHLSTGHLTGWTRLRTSGAEVTTSLDLPCNVSQFPKQLDVNWADGNRFNLTSLISAHCVDTPNLFKTGDAGFDTHIGSGVGLCNGLPASATWTFRDGGRTKNDSFVLNIAGGCSLSVSGNLRRGSLQALSH